MVSVRRRLTAQSTCEICSTPLSLTERLGGRTACRQHQALVAGRRDQARARYLGAITGFELDVPPTEAQERALRETPVAWLGDDWHRRIATGALQYLLDEALADGVLEMREEQALDRASELAQLSVEAAAAARPRLPQALTVARANDGRLPVVATPSVPLRRKEVCTLDVPATLLTNLSDESVTEMGVDAVKGRSVDFGLLDGHLAPLNARWRASDHGRLLVTDRRVFFEGKQLGIQVPYRRLIGLRLFRQAIRLRIAGRRAEPTIMVEEPIVAAAIAIGAAQALDRRLPDVYPVEPFDSLPVSPDSPRSGSVPVQG
jgi:hypothetical protein